MIKKLQFVVLLGFVLSGYFAYSQQIKNKLDEMGFDSIRSFSITVPQFENAFELYLLQPVNHKIPEELSFKQRIFVRHRGFDRPTVFVTEGYAAHYALRPSYNDEIAKALDANLVVVEHRYFGKSIPETLDWKQLTLENAATDLHRINQMMKKIYPGPWISTGISKGGQTSIYYRYFYPNDVVASVPYVAPLNFSVSDKRVFHFQDTVASPECRNKLLAIQRDLLQRREIFEPMFADSTQHRRLTFEMVGGIGKAYEYNVLEKGFAYWQWYPQPCDSLPKAGGDVNEIFKTFITATGYDFFADQSIIEFQPFFYQALTEMGFYTYNIKPFADLLQFVKNPGFTHTLSKDMHASYSKKLSKRVHRWLRKNGNNMLYIYGGYDNWSATAVMPGNKTNAVKLMLPKGSHTTRLRHFDEATKTKAVTTLKEWINSQETQ